MTPLNANINSHYIDEINSPARTSHTNLRSCGRTFIKFITDNKWNFLGGAIASGLFVKKWNVTGAILMAASAQSFVSNLVTLQTWIPRPVRQIILKAGGVTGIVVATAAACALIAAKSHIIAIPILIYSGYHFADSLGLVPRQVSLGVERYFPWRALMALPTMQATILGLLSCITFVSYIPQFVRFSYETGDLIMHRLLGMRNPSLKAINAPLAPKPVLTYDAIGNILNAKDTDYILNITHCSRSAASMLPKMVEDRHFEKLGELSKQISWIDNSAEILSHQSFITFLKEEFPSVSKKAIEQNPRIYAEKLAKAKGLTSHAYANQWLHARLGSVVDLLNGKWGRRVNGSQSELADAIEDSAKIIPLLLELKNNGTSNQSKLKKILFNFAINSSSRQASDIKAVAAKALHDIAEHKLKIQTNDPTTFAKRYEFQVRSALQNTRANIVNQLANGTESDLQEACDIIFPPTKKEQDERNRKALEKKTQESFLVTIHRSFLSFGFLPLSPYERQNCNLPIQYLAKFFQFTFDASLGNKNAPTAFDIYRKKLDSSLANCNQDEFWAYTEQLLATNIPDMNQREQLRQHFVGKEKDPATLQAFRRVLLVSWGVLRKKS